MRLPFLPPGIRELPREVRVLAAIAFAVAVGFGIVAPAIPLFARTFGVGRAAAALVVSIFAFMRFVSAFGGGRLVNRFGERRILVVGISIVAVSSAVAGLAQSYVQLLVLRGLGGIGSAMFTISAYGVLFRSTPPEMRGRASSLFGGGFLLGGITGPAFGGIITGISPRAPFFVYAVTLQAAILIGARYLPDTPPQVTTAGQVATVSLRAAFRNRSYLAAVVANASDNWAVIGVRSALLPLYVTDSLHRKPTWIGIGFVIVAAVNAAVLLPAGRFSDTRGRKPVLVGGCFMTTAGMVLLATEHSLPGYLVAMAVLGTGSGLLDVAPAAILGDTVGATRGGTVVAAYQMAGDAGTVVGPVLAGRVADVAGFGPAFGLTAGVMGLATLLALSAPETRVVTASDLSLSDPAPT